MGEKFDLFICIKVLVLKLIFSLKYFELYIFYELLI